MSDGEKKPTSKTIEELLKLISLGEPLTDSERKQMKDYKFWKTQPVPSFDEQIESEGPIDVPKTPDEIPDTPLPLLSGFEWDTIDLDDDKQLDEVYQLLYENYVEDLDATFRFKYSHEFFQWALKPPGWRKEWHLGVRVKDSRVLVGFISAVPVTLKLTQSNKSIKSVEINFLNVHKKLRTKRLAPVLIKEITRRVNKQDIWQALYTAGAVLPSPASVCRYTHRPINWIKLLEVGFSHLPANQTKEGMMAFYALPNTTKTKGLRPMKYSDVDQVHELFSKYQERFELIQVFSKEELAHCLLGGTPNGPASSVIKTYVVENDQGKISDFFSFYLLPFTVLENEKHKELGIAYLFYYATDSADTENYVKRLTSLINDALISSKQFDVDVFNCTTSQDNPLFIKNCKFGMGDGFLNYYLFNYRTFPIHGGIDSKTKEVTDGKGSGIGVVLQ